jgi:hypothetical protein
MRTDKFKGSGAVARQFIIAPRHQQGAFGMLVHHFGSIFCFLRLARQQDKVVKTQGCQALIDDPGEGLNTGPAQILL